MAFTYNRVDFVNFKAYNEATHSLALASGIVNFVTDGFNYNPTSKSITAGRGINNGLIFSLGKTGETETLTTSLTNYFVILKTELLNGVTSNSELVISATELASSVNLRYFTLFEIENNLIKQDYRFINYVKDMYFKPIGDDTFSLVLNGFESQPFNTSIIQNAYTKSESDAKYQYPRLTMDSSVGNAFGIPTNNLNDCMVGGFYRYVASTTGNPRNVSGVCTVRVNNELVFQECQDTNDDIYIRHYDGAWSLWEDVNGSITRDIWTGSDRLNGTITLLAPPTDFKYLRFKIGKVDQSPLIYSYPILDTSELKTTTFSTLSYPSTISLTGNGNMYKVFKLGGTHELIGSAINDDTNQLWCYAIDGIERINNAGLNNFRKKFETLEGDLNGR